MPPIIVDGAPRLVPRIVAGSLFMGAVVAIAAIAAWPIYRDWTFLLLVGVSALVAAGIATLAWRRGWGGWAVAGLLAARVLRAGRPAGRSLAPRRVARPLRGLGEVASGALFAWKDLITVDLPVGAYRNLLVPALLVFLVGTCAGLLLSWRSGRVAYAAVPVALGMISFGLVLRSHDRQRTAPPRPAHRPRARRDRPRHQRPARVPAVARLAQPRRPDAVAAPGGGIQRRPPLTSSVGRRSAEGLARRRHGRGRGARRGGRRPLRRARQRARSASLRRRTRTRRLLGGQPARRVPGTVRRRPGRRRAVHRDRRRSAPGPRAPGDARQLRRRDLPQRRDRCARSGPLRAGALDARRRQRTRRRRGDHDRRARRHLDADRRAARLGRVHGCSRGIARRSLLLPVGGRCRRADRRRRASTGDAYRIAAVEPATPELASIEAPGGLDESVDVPQSLRTWVDEHASGSGGAALAGLVDLLRERGYLSHALAVGDDTPLWMQSLADYTFQPSASGHSLARIDAMFARLLERETDPRAAASENYVAAVGDDEQFAAAVALVARELGFPSRVVVGARLASSDPALRTCEAGVCRAQDLAAWTEVQAAIGRLGGCRRDAPVRPVAQPRGDRAARPRERDRSAPRSRRGRRPAGPRPRGHRCRRPRRRRRRLDLSWLWPILRIAGSLCSCCCSCSARSWPSAAKASRRRSRRTQGDPAARVAGGWDEYVDAAVDSGRDSSPVLTRSELADLFETPEGRRSRRMPTARSSPAIRSPPRRPRRSGDRRRRAKGAHAGTRSLARHRRDRIVEIIRPPSGSLAGVRSASPKGEAPRISPRAHRHDHHRCPTPLPSPRRRCCAFVGLRLDRARARRRVPQVAASRRGRAGCRS